MIGELLPSEFYQKKLRGSSSSSAHPNSTERNKKFA